MQCIYGQPTPGKLIPVSPQPMLMQRGMVVREETVFHQPLNTEMRADVCEFLKRNIFSLSRGWILRYAAMDAERMVVEVELVEDTVYEWEHRPDGELYVFVVS